MKRLLVTGASGFLGWNICSAASRAWEVFGVEFAGRVKIPNVKMVNTDLTDFQELKGLFSNIQPDAVIHAAAASKPNYCQVNQTESCRINVETSVEIADLCAERNIPLVFTSTDMVFDGLNPPYKEEDTVCPVNIYGEQKVLAEERIMDRYPEAVVCRLSLMFGYSPEASTFFQQIIQSMRKGMELQLFSDEYRTFVSAGSVVSGIFLALENISGILHLGGNERVSRYDFGKLAAQVFQIDNAKLLPCSSKDIPMAAPRAPDLSLDNSKARALGFNPLPLEKELQGLRF